MARRGLVLLAGVAVGALAASGLAQNQVRMEDPGGSWREGSFDGGAFRATQVAGFIGVTGGPGPGDMSNSFLTFCLERSESIGLPQISNAEIATSTSGGDELDTRTAALYTEFRGGNNFGGPNAVTGLGSNGVSNGSETRSLQRAIWFLEGEIGNANNGVQLNDFEGDALAMALYEWANHAAHNMTGLGLVRVLRLYDPNNGGGRQDQLTLIPLPPAAWAGLGSLAGVMAIGYVRRRKQLS